MTRKYNVQKLEKINEQLNDGDLPEDNNSLILLAILTELQDINDKLTRRRKK